MVKVTDGKTLTVDELKEWIQSYFDGPRRVFTAIQDEILLQRWNDFEQTVAAQIRYQGLEQGKDLKEILANIVNTLTDAGRTAEFSDKRAPIPTPVDPKVFNKPAANVSDDEFFHCIWRNHAYLGAAFAIEKITAWRQEIYSADREKAANAKDMLKRIGATLAREGENPRQGTTYKEGWPTEIVASLYSRIYDDLVNNDRKFDGRNLMTQFCKLQEYASAELNIALGNDDMNRIQNDPAADYCSGAMFTERRLVAAFLAGKVLGMKTTGVLNALPKRGKKAT